MKNTTINRNYLFDNLKALLIFLVVFGHCIERYINDDNVLKSLYFFIYIFHMPLFIFVSGYFSKNLNKSKISIINSILIPYMIFNVIWYIRKSLMSDEIVFSFLKPGWTLWYLLTLFYFRICLKYLVKIKYILPISFLVGIISGVVGIPELSISRTFAFLPFFLLGYYFNEEHISRIRNIKNIYSYVFLAVILFISFYVIYNFDANVKFLYNIYSYSDFKMSIGFGMILKTIIYGFALICGLCIINIISSKKTIYSYIGNHTLIIYLLHIYLIKFLENFVDKWDYNLLSNIIILSSGLVITIILSNKLIKNIYDNSFNKIKFKTS